MGEELYELVAEAIASAHELFTIVDGDEESGVIVVEDTTGSVYSITFEEEE